MEKHTCDSCKNFSVGTGYVNTPQWALILLRPKAHATLSHFLLQFVGFFGGILSVEVDSAGIPKEKNQGLHLKYECIMTLMNDAGFEISDKTLQRNLNKLTTLGVLSKGVPAQHSHFTRIYFLNTAYANQWDHYAKEKANDQLAQSKYKNQVRIVQNYEVDPEDQESKICGAVADAAVKQLPDARAALVRNVVYSYLMEGGSVMTAMNSVFDLKRKADRIAFSHNAFTQGLKSRDSAIPREYLSDIDQMNKKLAALRMANR